MHANQALIETFYRSFQNKDAAGMIACYHDDIEFSDPAFGTLKGAHAKGMWKMLVGRATDLTLTFDQVQADEHTGSAHWEAVYTFSKTKRRVHNKIDARFDFQDGKIIRHVDSFSLWRWSSMALGPVGTLLGWSPIVRNKVRQQSVAALREFMGS